ncbi:MAG: DUF1822 family protein [Cyanobacteria bacterium CRU_2_1]|nr:DUF1822 family protein [Cyanobacteria bacterium RU_5_0]NJR62454.1 DUF1822 family protein [Cyanobacteria bacterium CRU_2_1]
MTNYSLFFTETELKHIYLEISPDAQAQAWRRNQRFSTPSRRWNAYLNQLCLDAFLNWLRQAYPQATSWMNPAHYSSVWEMVDGSAIVLQSRSENPIRLVLIQNAAIDLSELRVPQEWVDIPSWAGDYYLAAQVEPDDGWIRIWGFTTHARLKNGTYDATDRTYSLDAEALITDLDVLWEAQQRCPNEVTQAVLAPLPALPLPQVENLITRLGNPEVILPRLEIPFAMWGALIEHSGWRQRVYHQRLGITESWSVSQWLRSGVSELAQQLGWQRDEFQPGLVGARGAEATEAPGSLLSRQLTIANQPYELRVIPQVAPDRFQGSVWRFELRRSVSEGATPEEQQIPRGVKLRLLTEDLQPFENNEATALRAVNHLYVIVALAPGEGLVWEIEPTPENYEREILRF